MALEVSKNAQGELEFWTFLRTDYPRMAEICQENGINATAEDIQRVIHWGSKAQTKFTGEHFAYHSCLCCNHANLTIFKGDNNTSEYVC